MWGPCTNVCTKIYPSRYYTLCFCIKRYNFHLLIYIQPPVVHHFTNWWHLSHFPWTTAFTRTFATSILWCYNFNGMIKWYDILCATLYLESFEMWCWRRMEDTIWTFRLRFFSPSQYIAICSRAFSNRVWRSLLMACSRYIQWYISYFKFNHNWLMFGSS